MRLKRKGQKPARMEKSGGLAGSLSTSGTISGYATGDVSGAQRRILTHPLAQ